MEQKHVYITTREGGLPSTGDDRVESGRGESIEVSDVISDVREALGEHAGDMGAPEYSEVQSRVPATSQQEWWNGTEDR
jgi:hypothetical protein